MDSKEIISRLLEHFVSVRYVSIYYNGQLISIERSGLNNNSSSDSDKYEELLVNPALLTLTRQRGEIDCGGLSFIIVGYGNFYQLIFEIEKGHLSICLEPYCIPTVEAVNIQVFLADRFQQLIFKKRV